MANPFTKLLKRKEAQGALNDDYSYYTNKFYIQAYELREKIRTMEIEALDPDSYLLVLKKTEKMRHAAEELEEKCKHRDYFQAMILDLDRYA